MIREPRTYSIRTPRTETTKRCPICKRMLPFENFPPSKQSWDGLYPYCRGCRSTWKRGWNQNNPERFADERRRCREGSKRRRVESGLSCGDVARLSRYGVSIEEYQTMLKRQHGVCAICGRLPDVRKNRNGKFDVDHCHETGKVRGLLCNRCNMAIGLLRESPLIAMAAADYLDEHGNGKNDPIPTRISVNLFSIGMLKRAGCMVCGGSVS